MLKLDWGKSCLTILSLATLGSLVAGCAGGLSGFGGNSGVSTSSLNGAGEAMYAQTLYKFVNTQGCVQCHGGNTPEPPFASPDLATAYAAATGNQIGSTLPLVNFADPDASIIIVYAGNSHCNVGACSDPSVRPTVQALIEQWAAAEVASGNKGTASALPTYMSARIAVPTTIPAVTSSTVLYMQFPLSGLNPSVASLGNAVLEMQVQMITETEYRFTNPRIAGNTAAVNITGLHVFIASSSTVGPGAQDSDQGMTWVSAAASLPISTRPASLTSTTAFTTPLLSSTPLQAEVQSADANGKPTDYITIGIDNIQ